MYHYFRIARHRYISTLDIIINRDELRVKLFADYKGPDGSALPTYLIKYVSGRTEAEILESIDVISNESFEAITQTAAYCPTDPKHPSPDFELTFKVPKGALKKENRPRITLSTHFSYAGDQAKNVDDPAGYCSCGSGGSLSDQSFTIIGPGRIMIHTTGWLVL